MSSSCPLQKVDSSSRYPSLFLSSLGLFSVLFLRAKLGECVASWFALTPPPLKWRTEQKTHSKFANAQCDATNLAIKRVGVLLFFFCCCQLLLLNHNFRLRYLILSVSNSNFNLFNLIFGLILPVGYLKTSRMAEHIYNVNKVQMCMLLLLLLSSSKQLEIQVALCYDFKTNP